MKSDEYPTMDQPHYNLKQAWRLKGACCPWEGFRRYPYIQPKAGFPDGFIGGKGVFTNETIKEWLPLLDEDMEAYNRKYRTGAKPRSKIKKGRRLNVV